MAGGAAVKSLLTFDEAWPILQEEAINKIIDNLEGVRSHQFTSEEYMRFYTIVYNVCYPNPVGPEVEKLYDQYQKTFEDYIFSKVLPSLRGKKNEELLYTGKKNLPSLVGTSHLTFYNLVYGEINDEVRDAIISLINREREGEQIDQAIVREALDIYVEIGDGSWKYYITNKSYEDYMLKVEECLNQEKTRVSNYLKFRNRDKVLKVCLLLFPLYQIL
ncbi:hypothetical protein Pfo_017918 [Paulownia fortunei]|nr:hypothetical protein Pfo_017918 [Paulownia fortunei]